MQNSINKVKKVVTTRKQYLKWPLRSTFKEKNSFLLEQQLSKEKYVEQVLIN